jgi:hypothetical protein
MEGNDYHPKVGYIINNDTVYVSIIWLHQNDSKIDIWMAKEVFKPIITSVRNEHLDISSFNLMQNYPNPFNPITTIEYTIQKPAQVKIKVYDILGNDILTLEDGYKTSGKHKVIFNEDDLASGIYFYSINYNGNTKTKSMILLK